MSSPPDVIQDLLDKTSRTFALSIPLLPEPTRREVGIAYLLFRIADTFEDAARWPREQRLSALDAFERLVAAPDPAAAAELRRRGLETVPIEHPGYIELIDRMPQVLEAFAALRPHARRLIAEHTARTTRGMRDFVARADAEGQLRLDGVDELRRYCYVVAGIVGEMLTELFLLEFDRLAGVAEPLRARARAFGEALQLVNILKDASDDREEGRRYLPAGVAREEIFALARRDLADARDYTLCLQRAGAPRGVVAFCALPVNLAFATLDRVEAEGAGAKLTRDEVWRITREMAEALERDAPAVLVP